MMTMLTTNKRIELFLNMMNQSGKQLISPEFMNWLTVNGFFTQAASTKFHSAYEGQSSWDAFDKAIRKYETVLWTHTADMYASKVLDC